MHPALEKEFRRKMAAADAPDREVLEAIFQEKGLAEIPLPALLQALEFPLTWIQTNALYELMRRRNGAGKMPGAGDVLSFLGEQAWSAGQLQPLLHTAGIKTAPFSPETTHLVLGTAPGPLRAADLEGRTLLLEEELLPLVLHLPAFFLLRTERAAERSNVRQMLHSPDSQNALLALGLLEQAGLPADFQTDLFALWRSIRPLPVRQLAAKVLQRYASGELKRNLLRHFFAFIGGDRELVLEAQETYDPAFVLDMRRYYHLKFVLSRNHRLNSEVLVKYHRGFVGGDPAERMAAVERLAKDGRLRLPPTTLAFPEEAYRLQGIRSMELEGCPLSGLPEGISAMRDLIKLRFSAPLEQLPADLPKLPQLRSFAIFDGKMEAFPKLLSELPQLKYFTWVRSLGFPLHTLKVPAAFFKSPLSSLHLSEDRIVLPPECFTLDSLQSLVMPLLAAEPYLERIADMPALQRLQLELEGPQRAGTVLERLPGWRLEDVKENSLSFVKQ